MMAAQQSSGVSCRRRQPMAGSTEHGVSYLRSPRCQHGEDTGMGRFLATPATELGGSAMAHGGAWPCSGLARPAWVVTPSLEHR